jgi:hypothetical protein
VNIGSYQLKPGLACALLGAAALAACGVEPVSNVNTGVTQDALTTENGLSMNGLSMNGLSMNGLSMNGLSTATFSSWFDEDAATRNMVMRYLARCSYPAGQSLTWTSPTTNVTYTWPGVLGLLPGWASGNPMNPVEQQVLTACLAAHANGYGVHVDIAIEGNDATGVPMPIGPTELSDYPIREGAFFGNVVSGVNAMFTCADHGAWGPSISSSRTCALHNGKPGTLSTSCAPIVYVGPCASICQPDPTGSFYDTCTWDGVAYPALATRMRPASQFTCGDGVCQFTESCGTGSTFDSCQADCGVCPVM